MQVKKASGRAGPKLGFILKFLERIFWQYWTASSGDIEKDIR